MSSIAPRSRQKPQQGPRLAALLRVASQAMTERLAGWIAASGFEGVQPAHSAVMQPLWEKPEGLRITALARASRITKQSMSALVTDLEGAGYVERIADPDDARAVRIRLTSRGRAYGRAVRAFARSVETEWAEQVGAQRLEELQATLELLRERVFPADEDGR
jgi:DNA-binding MarR family transcriptional regulator